MNNVSRRSFVKSAALGAAASLSVAGVASADEATAYENTIVWNGLYDVVVVGMGIAGETAAITAADAGAKVLILEKAPNGLDGGNSRYCHQAPIGCEASKVDAVKEYYRSLRGEYNQPSDAKIDAFVEELVNNTTWFESLGATTYPYADVFGAEFGAEYPELPGSEGMTINFTVAPTYADGKMFKFLKQQIADRAESIDLWYNAPATDLIRDSQTGVVIGVTAQVDGRSVNIRVKNGIVMCCGGFENNKQMLQDYAGIPTPYPIACHFNEGDGHLMAARIGAQLSGMSNVACYINGLYEDGVTAEWNSGTRIGKAKYTTSLIFVGADGTRFMNENFKSRHGYTPWHGGYQSQRLPMAAWCVFDEKARLTTHFSNANNNGCEEAIASGLFLKADTLEELAALIEVPAENLVATVERFNFFCAQGEDMEFHRNPENMQPLEEGPYYAFKLVQSILNTQGGPYRDENCQILDNDGVAIPHLYGAGEFGAIYTSLYQGGGNVGECLAYGRISGRSAAALKEDGQPAADLAIDLYVPQPEEEPVWEVGENQYIGIVDSHCGDLVVRVTLEGDVIAAVEVLKTYDTPNIGLKAINKLAGQVVGMTAEQVAEVDTVTNATWSSMAFKEAVAAALA